MSKTKKYTFGKIEKICYSLPSVKLVNKLSREF